MEFQPAGQQECLSNFIVVQQEKKPNKFSWFSFCNMSVWQCKGKKNPKFLEKVLKEIKLMNCEQVMVAQKGMWWRAALFTHISEGSTNSPWEGFATLSGYPRMEPRMDNLAWIWIRKYSRLLQVWGMWWQLSQTPCCRSHFLFLLLLLAQFCRNSAQVFLSSTL